MEQEKTIFKEDSAYLAHTYARYPVAFVEGNGCILKGIDGKTYIDCAAGIGVNVFGVNDTVWKDAVIKQINEIQHVCNLYYSEPQVKLAKLLCEKTGAKKVFFGNSGAEANECAIKAARKYSHLKYGEGRHEIVSLTNSFHGRTLATLTATGQDEFHEYFGPFCEGFRYADPNMASVKKVCSDKTCAILLEVVQGEGGVNVLDKNFLKDVESFCKEKDILFICDEVQTGNGRTGYLYAYEAFGLQPDIVTTAKALGGGLPIGACLLFEKCENAFTFGDHGSTFGGNPVSCAGGVTILSRLTDNFLQEVRKKGDYFKRKLLTIPNVKNVSGLGLLIGIETDKPARKLSEQCLEKGLIVLTAQHNKIRLLPPLTITYEQIDKAIEILNEVIGK
jgi:acetylornithine/N-succinyldiaminopimelate aminotransferase